MNWRGIVRDSDSDREREREREREMEREREREWERGSGQGKRGIGSQCSGRKSVHLVVDGFRTDPDSIHLHLRHLQAPVQAKRLRPLRG